MVKIITKTILTLFFLLISYTTFAKLAIVYVFKDINKDYCLGTEIGLHVFKGECEKEDFENSAMGLIIKAITDDRGNFVCVSQLPVLEKDETNTAMSYIRVLGRDSDIHLYSHNWLSYQGVVIIAPPGSIISRGEHRYTVTNESFQYWNGF